MQLPFFYINNYNPAEKIIQLDEDNSRHVVQVLRMQKGEKLHLTDGRGSSLTAEITDAHKKHCTVQIVESSFIEPAQPQIAIAISPLKNNTRFEWFLEKATEIGISEIIPLICSRTEKHNVRYDRMQGILVSAMLQSRQVWLPKLHEPISFQNFIADKNFESIQRKFIAHCIEDEKSTVNFDKACSIILIGPEGDFTPAEIEAALKAGYTSVSLGNTRLRTETAGMVAAVKLKLGN